MKTISEVNIKNDTSLPIHIHAQKRLISSLVILTSHYTPKQIHKLVSKMIIVNPTYFTVLFYFERVRAATPKVMHEDLDFLSHATFYRTIRILKKNGLIKEIIRAKPRRLGGRKSSVYAVPDYEDIDIIRALQNEQERIMPFFDLSKRVYQIYLEDVMEPLGINEVYKKQLGPIVNRIPFKGYNKADVIDQALTLFRRQGYKVIE